MTVSDTETHWQRLWRMYDEAIACSEEAARTAYVDALAADDADLARELRRLLAVRGKSEGFLARPPTIVVERLHLHDATTSSAAESPAQPMIGKDIAGRYVIEEFIGSGGMGAVYAARQRSPRRRIALKIVRSGALNARAVNRFRLEAEALARLHHPGIAQVFDSGTFDAGEGPNAYLAMEFIEGPTLKSFMEATPPSLDERVRLLARVCDAIEHAHQRGVIHCDLKPTNILIDVEAEAVQPKVVDFGVSRIVGVDVTASLAGDVRELAGTLAYMSPERLAESGGDARADATIQTDVFALGVIGYEVLAGALPVKVEATSVLLAIQAYAQATPRRLGEHDASLRGDLETIIHKAMAREPEQRYASAGALAADLRRWLAHEPIIARRASKVYQFRKFVQRNKALSIGVTIALAALITGATVATWQAVQATRARKAADLRAESLQTLAFSVLNELQTALAAIPQTTPLRARLIEGSVSALEQIESEAAGNAELLAKLASAHQQLGSIQFNPRGANVGDRERALAQHDHALSLIDRAQTISGPTLALSRLRSDTCNLIAEVHRTLGNVDDAVSWHLRAAAASLDAPGRDLFDLGTYVVQNTRAHETLYAAKRLDEATALVGPVDRIVAETFTTDVSPEQMEGATSVAYNVARLWQSENQPRKAIEWFDVALTLAQHIPTEKDRVGYAADINRSSSVCFEEIKEFPEAMARAQAAATSYEWMIAQDAASPAPRSVAAMSHALASRSAAAMGQVAQCIACLRAANGHYETSYQHDSTSAYSRNNYVAGLMNQLGQMVKLSRRDDVDVDEAAQVIECGEQAIARLETFFDEAARKGETIAWTPEQSEKLAREFPPLRDELRAFAKSRPR